MIAVGEDGYNPATDAPWMLDVLVGSQNPEMLGDLPQHYMVQRMTRWTKNYRGEKEVDTGVGESDCHTLEEPKQMEDVQAQMITINMAFQMLGNLGFLQ